HAPATLWRRALLASDRVGQTPEGAALLHRRRARIRNPIQPALIVDAVVLGQPPRQDAAARGQPGPKPPLRPGPITASLPPRRGGSVEGRLGIGTALPPPGTGGLQRGEISGIDD